MIKYRIVYSMIVASLLISCQSQPTNWPKHVLDEMWLPTNAKKIEYSKIGGSFQSNWRVDMCFPAREVINNMATTMSQRGWKRLGYDIFNSSKSSRAGISPDWSYFIDSTRKQEEDVWQLIDDWEDGSGNFIRYLLMYRTKRESKSKERYLSKPEHCTLKAVAIYMSVDVRRAVEKETAARMQSHKEQQGVTH